MLLMPLFALALVPATASCSGSSDIVGIHMSNPETLDVYYGNFSVEGINVTVDFRDKSTKEIPLADDMINEVERLKFFKMGPQAINVVYRNRYKTTMNVEVKLNQFKDSYALVSYECVYDGAPHAVTLNQELPEGATITYPYGNIFTNAGTYEVVGVISKNGYDSRELKATLTILPAEREGSDDIIFPNTTLIYNGLIRSIEAENVPEGVEVSYETFDNVTGTRVNRVVDAGEYKVVAHFTDTSPNYAQIPDKEAILTIEKARYDLSGIAFEDVTKEYDGQSYFPKLVNEDRLPSGITVSYSCKDEEGNVVTSNATAGTYTMIATFSGGNTTNYHEIEPMTATLTVAKRVIKIKDVITFNSATVEFDKEPDPEPGQERGYFLKVEGLPDNVSVEYENNGQHYAGEYKVIARFSAIDPNETVDIAEMEAYLVINRVRRSVMVYNDATKEYDKAFSQDNIKIENGVAKVVGIDESVFRLVSILFSDPENENAQITPDKFVDKKSYPYVATFEYIDPKMNDSVILSQESDIFTYEAA